MAEFTTHHRSKPDEKATAHRDEPVALGPVANADIDWTHTRPDVICAAEAVAG